jgi:hypothetical protein
VRLNKSVNAFIFTRSKATATSLTHARMGVVWVMVFGLIAVAMLIQMARANMVLRQRNDWVNAYYRDTESLQRQLQSLRARPQSSPTVSSAFDSDALPLAQLNCVSPVNNKRFWPPSETPLVEPAPEYRASLATPQGSWRKWSHYQTSEIYHPYPSQINAEPSNRIDRAFYSLSSFVFEQNYVSIP